MNDDDQGGMSTKIVQKRHLVGSNLLLNPCDA